jgi:hypothetical protein
VVHRNVTAKRNVIAKRNVTAKDNEKVNKVEIMMVDVKDYTKRKETVRLPLKGVVKVEIDGDLCVLLRKVFVVNVNQLKHLEVLEVQIPSVNTKTHIIINDIMALAVLQNVQKTTEGLNEVKNGVNNMKLNVAG